MKQVSATIPATTANLGPGFDCLGLALALYNEVTFTAVPRKSVTITIRGEGASKIPTDNKNLVLQAAERIFRHVGQRPPGLAIKLQNNIPVSSGLGSSAAAVLGGMLAANALLDSPLSRSDLLLLAAQMEGHPDNVAPALYGCLVLVNGDRERLYVEQIPIPPLRVVIVLPDFDLLTVRARAALPKQVPLADAVFNVGRMGLLVRALERGNYVGLDVAMQDKLHQPYRLPLIPGMAAAFTAAQAAGAAGVALSGAGPGVIAFAPQGHERIAQAMTAAFTKAGLNSRTWILPVDTQGSRLAENHVE
jgi:homoserine kinase